MTNTTITEPVRDLLAAILEAIDLPHPATFGGTEAHDRLLNTRARHARLALRSLLDDGPDLGPAWNAAYLRRRIAEHPVAGYVTVDQAHAALDAGKPWSAAVALPESVVASGDAEQRCGAAHSEDPTPCGGPVAVTVLDATNAGADGCEHHGARLLASLDRGRVYPLPDAPEGAAIRVFTAAQHIRPFPWIEDAPRTLPSQLSRAENQRGGESQ